MTHLLPSITILASGDHGYLYGLLFLIVSLAIGAASKHIQKIIPQLKIIPFTVFLLIIGLVMGFMNRPWVEKNKRGEDAHGAHGDHGNASKANDDHHSNHGNSLVPVDHAKDANHSQGHHGPEGLPSPELTADVQQFLESYRAHLIRTNPDSIQLKLTDKQLLIHLGKVLESKNAWGNYQAKYPGLRDAYLKASAPPAPTKPTATAHIPVIPSHSGHSTPPVLDKVPTPAPPSVPAVKKESHATDHKSSGDDHGQVGGHHEEKKGLAKVIEFLHQAIYWGS